MCVYIYIYREREMCIITFNTNNIRCIRLGRDAAAAAGDEAGGSGELVGVGEELLCIYIYIYVYVYRER